MGRDGERGVGRPVGVGLDSTPVRLSNELLRRARRVAGHLGIPVSLYLDRAARVVLEADERAMLAALHEEIAGVPSVAPATAAPTGQSWTTGGSPGSGGVVELEPELESNGVSHGSRKRHAALDAETRRRLMAEVRRLRSEGLLNAEVARRLEISPRLVTRLYSEGRSDGDQAGVNH